MNNSFPASAHKIMDDNRLLQLALRAAQAGVFVHSISQNATFWDLHSLEIFGLQAQDYDGGAQAWRERVHPEDLEAVNNAVQGALADPTQSVYDVQYRILRPNGDLRHVRAQAWISRASDGRAETIIGLHFDISEQKQAETALKTLSRAVEHSPASVVITDPTGKIAYVNRRFSEVTGYSAEEALGNNPRLLKSGVLPPDFYSDMWTTIKSGKDWRGEFHNRRKNGEHFWELASISPILDESGAITHFVAVKEEITERKRMEEALRVAKDEAEAANRAKSAFLANMSHELRTPLNGILGYVQLMQLDPELTENQCGKLDAIARSGDHLLKLINSVLDLSKIEMGKIVLDESEYDLRQLLDQVARLFEPRVQQKALRFRVSLGAALPQFLWGDEHKMRQILINLLGNAVKFTPYQGHVTLTVEVLSPEAGSNQRRLAFEVSDSGPGIAPHEIAEIFEAFTQSSSGKQAVEGAGLGLTISRRFAQLMGGDISARSPVGQGAIFRLEIPLQLAQTQARTLDATQTVVGLAAGQPAYRMLVADDNAEGRRLLGDLLRQAGFEVRQVADGREALQAWHDWQPHFIWMDMRMPEMDGFAATRQIKAHPGGSETIIVALTASAFNHDQQAAWAAGCNDFLSKPYRFEDIFTTIAHHLPVEYRYAEEAPSVSTPAVPDLHLALQALTPEQRAALQQALLAGNVRQAQALVDALPSAAGASAHVLDERLRLYQFEEILAALD